jgi:hypothetical protein
MSPRAPSGFAPVEAAKSVQFGFLYLDEFKIVHVFGPGNSAELI